jgi:rubrerythrin
MTYKIFMNKLRRALKDEVQAAKMYINMIEMIPNEKIRKMLTEIRNDELDHLHKLEQIKKMFKSK